MSSFAESPSPTVVELVSKENDVFTITLSAVTGPGGSGLVREFYEEDDPSIQRFPLPLVGKKTLTLIVEFMNEYHKNPMRPIEKPLRGPLADVVQEWYTAFLDVEQEVLFELILAANYMDVQPLLNLACAAVAWMIKGKTPEEIRMAFNIVTDFTPEEEQAVREENRWCEED